MRARAMDEWAGDEDEVRECQEERTPFGREEQDQESEGKGEGVTSKFKGRDTGTATQDVQHSNRFNEAKEGLPARLTGSGLSTASGALRLGCRVFDNDGQQTHPKEICMEPYSSRSLCSPPH